jgi:hypothetical protein
VAALGLPDVFSTAPPSYLRLTTLWRYPVTVLWRSRPAFGYHYVMRDPSAADETRRRHGYLVMVPEEVLVYPDHMEIEGILPAGSDESCGYCADDLA